MQRLFDTKSLLHLEPFHGDKGAFQSWKWSCLVTLKAINKDLYEGLRKVEDNSQQDYSLARLSEEDKALAEQAYTFLALVCKDEASSYISTAEENNGYAAWQSLLRAKTVRNASRLLNQLLEPTFSSADPRINIRQWNKNAMEYTARTGDVVSDALKKSVYLNKIAPAEMRQHLLLNQSRLDTPRALQQEIEDYCDVMEENNQKDTTYGFVAPVTGGDGKGKEKEKANCIKV